MPVRCRAGTRGSGPPVQAKPRLAITLVVPWGWGEVMYQTLQTLHYEPASHLDAASAEVFFVGTGSLFKWPMRAFVYKAAE